MKKALIIYNPEAGLKSKKDISAEVQKKLQKIGYDANVFLLDSGFEKNIAGFKLKEFSLVVAIGGDGTAKVAARTILENKLDAKLAIIPFGSANILAKSLGLPTNTNRAIKLLAEKNTVELDVGLINNEHYFLVGVSVGYISEVVLSTAVNLKKRLGVWSYVIHTLSNQIKIGHKKFIVNIDGKKMEIDGNSLVIFNSCNLYGMKPRIKISPYDGLLNLLVTTNKNIFTLIGAGLNLWINHQPKKFVFTDEGKLFKIKLPERGLDSQIDGDHLELPRNIEVKVIHKAIKVINYG